MPRRVTCTVRSRNRVQWIREFFRRTELTVHAIEDLRTSEAELALFLFLSKCEVALHPQVLVFPPSTDVLLALEKTT